MIKYLEIIFIFFNLITNSKQIKRDLSILKEQIKNHPYQTLQDVYKSCYQDEYGPGHIIANESSSLNYIFTETNSIEENYNPPTLFEKTGLEGNYIRVDLNLLKNRTIPFFILYKSLLLSSEIGSQKTDEGWADIWSSIVEEIKNSDIVLEDFEKDINRLYNISKSDDKVVHHSELYENTYHPHYRIIEKNIFEKYIKPFIN